VSFTDVLDLLGVACVALFAFAVWPPAALLVVGVAALLISWRRSA
jgi:hypothetical protein